MPAAAAIPDILRILQDGQVDLEGQFMQGSNYTFFARAVLDERTIPVVYKPARGERPLWDFPARSLGKRETAAYLLSEKLGWSLVPPTVYRRKGPLGPGSLQQYLAHDPNYHIFNFSNADIQRLRPVAVFDLISNNADRKGSHVLKAEDGRLFCIDHGLCFHREDKLRTVIWNFAGEPLPPHLGDGLEQLLPTLAPGQDFHTRLRALLQAGEIKALARRITRLLAEGRFPAQPRDQRAFPWPLV